MIRTLKDRAKLYLRLIAQHASDQKKTQIALAQELARLRAEIALRTPRNLVLRGFKIYSQCDEDGIIAAIFDVLGGGGRFIEIGCGDGLENNTHALLLRGWRGVWVDGSAVNVGRISDALGGTRFSRLLVERQFLDRTNTGSACARYAEFLGTSEPELFSLDIDGNDLHVLEAALAVLEPKVLCIEYNAKYPPPMALTMDYNPGHSWQSDDYHGASLVAYANAIADRYTLLTCTVSGTNAFFVRNDMSAKFHLYDIAELYQPPRYHLTELPMGSRASLRWLRQCLHRVDDA
ncbi:MAG: hypothetical protein AB7G08_28575 [Hyphomicrobiaceae bacterium]